MIFKIFSLITLVIIYPQIYKSMGYHKKDVTPLLTHWSYVFFALTHRNGFISFVLWWSEYWPVVEFYHVSTYLNDNLSNSKVTVK